MTDDSTEKKETEEGEAFFKDLAGLSEPNSSRDLEAVYDVVVNVTAVLGNTQIPVNKLIKLHNGDILPLDKRVGEALEIFVNNRLVARGEVVAVEGKLGIIMTEIIKVEASE